MATKQGICKNCGSLITVDTNDELCECLFCDCVFPTAEALNIYENPDGVEFPNLPQPKRETKVVRHTATPVFDDVVEKAVKVDKAINKETKVEKLFEISPDDIQTPKNVKRNVWLITAICVVIVLGISIPLFIVRHNHQLHIDDKIRAVISSGQFTVSTEREDGYAVGYKISGMSNNKVSLVTEYDTDKAKVFKAFTTYCAIRGEEYGYDSGDIAHFYDDVVLTVYAPNGKFTMTGDKTGATEDMVEVLVPEEEVAETTAAES